VQLVATKQAKQVACPISGKDVSADQVSKVAGVEVHFCCENCKGKVDKAGDDGIDLVFADKAFDKAYKVAKEEKKEDKKEEKK
jgi:hypothetical protein